MFQKYSLSEPFVLMAIKGSQGSTKSLGSMEDDRKLNPKDEVLELVDTYQTHLESAIDTQLRRREVIGWMRTVQLHVSIVVKIPWNIKQKCRTQMRTPCKCMSLYVSWTRGSTGRQDPRPPQAKTVLFYCTPPLLGGF